MLLIFPYVQSRLVFFFKIVLVVPNPPFCISTKKISITSVLSKWQEFCFPRRCTLFVYLIIILCTLSSPSRKKEVIFPPVSLQLNTVCEKLRKGKENSKERNVRAIIIFAGCNCWKNHEKKEIHVRTRRRRSYLGRCFLACCLCVFLGGRRRRRTNNSKD